MYRSTLKTHEYSISSHKEILEDKQKNWAKKTMLCDTSYKQHEEEEPRKMNENECLKTCKKNLGILV
jgi:hypothetical protein